MPKNITEIKLHEILANTLYAMFEPGAAGADWRRDADVRARWRSAACELTGELGLQGVKIAVRSSDVLDKCVLNMATEPAACVYNLEEETDSPTYGEVLDNPAPA